jgi:hypothetical protein
MLTLSRSLAATARVALNDYGEVEIDDTAVIDNDSGEKTKSKLDEFGGTQKISRSLPKRLLRPA